MTLALMEFIAAGANFAAEVKTLVEQGHSLSWRALIVFVVADEELDLADEQSAEGNASARGEGLGLFDGLPIEPDY
jgi:hypothetical protein